MVGQGNRCLHMKQKGIKPMYFAQWNETQVRVKIIEEASPWVASM